MAVAAVDDGPPVVNFDNLARPYRWLEFFTFGPMLMRCRCEYLKELDHCRHALVLGDGDGRFLARLLAHVPHLTADVVDSSEEMLRVLSTRVAAIGAGQQVSLQHVDALVFEPTGRKYDLVVTHFFLDCFDDGEIASLLTRILPCISRDALWVVSEFAIPAASGWRRWASFAARGLIRMLYGIFGWATGLRIRSLPHYASAMRSHGFELQSCRNRLAGILVSELWRLDNRTFPVRHK